MWEVKPLNGASATAQIKKYSELGGYEPAPFGILYTMKDIPIIGDIYMKITFPKIGEARYSFYKNKTNDKGHTVEDPVSNPSVRNKMLEDYLDGKWKEFLEGLPSLPIPGLGPVPVPALP